MSMKFRECSPDRGSPDRAGMSLSGRVMATSCSAGSASEALGMSLKPRGAGMAPVKGVEASTSCAPTNCVVVTADDG